MKHIYKCPAGHKVSERRLNSDNTSAFCPKCNRQVAVTKVPVIRTVR